MATTNAVNFTPPFKMSTDSSVDHFEPADQTVLPQALDTHNHTTATGKGLPVPNMNATGRVAFAQGVGVVSASHMTLGTDGNFFWITGTTTINLISADSWQDGSQIYLAFDSTITVKYNQTLSGNFLPIMLKGSADYLANAGEILTLQLNSFAGQRYWREMCRTPQAWQTLVPLIGRIQHAQGANVSSANNLTLGSDGNYFGVTGAVQVNLLDSTGWQGGSEVTFKATAGFTLKHNQGASGAFKPMLLASGADFVMAGNATVTLVYDTGATAWVEKARKA